MALRSTVGIVALFVTLRPATGCEHARYVSVDAARFEAARARCGAEPDAQRFVVQAVTGACDAGDDVRAATRRHDRLRVDAIETRGSSRVLVVTLEDASDDSIRSEQHRIELEPGPSGWRIAWVGLRWRCWPERGHEDFGTRACS